MQKCLLANITEALSNLYRYNVKGDGYASVEEEVKRCKGVCKNN